nr:RNA-directed DNA polymerase, eukaryota [Tanacetum cinerariifolium]
HSSDVVSTKGEADNVVEGSGLHNDDEGSDTEAVSDTYFGDNVVNVDNAEVQGSNTRIAKEVGNVKGNLYTDNRSCGFKLKEGGSILDILDEMIKVGQTMGFSMHGCTKDMEGIIGAQGENVVFR